MYRVLEEMLLPYVGHPALPDDHVCIVCQADMRFFLEDCKVREYFDAYNIPLPPQQNPPSSASSSGPLPVPAPARVLGRSQGPNLDENVSHASSSSPEPVRTNREGLAPVLREDEQDANLCSPELLDLLRIRVAARQWTEHNPQGQADFIWVCYNTSPCTQNTSRDKFLEGWCSDDELANFKKNKGMDYRKSSVQAGDIMVMMTARFARKMLRVIVPLTISFDAT